MLADPALDCVRIDQSVDESAGIGPALADEELAEPAEGEGLAVLEHAKHLGLRWRQSEGSQLAGEESVALSLCGQYQVDAVPQRLSWLPSAKALLAGGPAGGGGVVCRQDHQARVAGAA